MVKALQAAKALMAGGDGAPPELADSIRAVTAFDPGRVGPVGPPESIRDALAKGAATLDVPADLLHALTLWHRKHGAAGWEDAAVEALGSARRMAVRAGDDTPADLTDALKEELGRFVEDIEDEAAGVLGNVLRLALRRLGGLIFGGV